MNKLKELRTERGLSIRGMEIKTGIKNNTYSRYETGERDMSTDVLRKLADFFEVSIDYLLNYDGFCLFVTHFFTLTFLLQMHQNANQAVVFFYKFASV